MRIISLLISLLIIGGSLANANAAFKLGTSRDDSQLAASNKGVIGIRYVKRKNDMGQVQEIYPGTPAVGQLEVGDQILKVNGIDIVPFDANQVYQLMAGAPGTSVELTVYRCAYASSCKIISRTLQRQDMNYIPTDNVFRIYKYGTH